MRTRALILLVVAAGLVAGALFGGVIGERGNVAQPATAASPTSVSPSAESLLTGGRGSGTRVDQLEAAVRARPADAPALTALGYAYLQRWRVSADASYLPRAEEALRRAQRLAPNDANVVSGLGALALTRHEFRNALALGRRAVELAPYSVAPRGIVGDALLELGRYREAFASFEKMVALKPTLAGYSRIAYARELIGRRDGAIAAMRLAYESSGGLAEPAAWSAVELAKLQLSAGRLTAAEKSLRSALRLVPGYVFALEQLARVDAARGRFQAAIRRARTAAQAVPLPQFVALHADLLERAGKRKAARTQRATVGAIDRILVANGVRTDVESVLFEADHRLRAATLVERARGAREARPSILGDDALSWALARTGRCREARRWSDRALRLGTKDGLLFFHRAYIEDCLGKQEAARTWARRALTESPHFSVRWEPAARRLAAG